MHRRFRRGRIDAGERALRARVQRGEPSEHRLHLVAAVDPLREAGRQRRGELALRRLPGPPRRRLPRPSDARPPEQHGRDAAAAGARRRPVVVRQAALEASRAEQAPLREVSEVSPGERELPHRNAQMRGCYIAGPQAVLPRGPPGVVDPEGPQAEAHAPAGGDVDLLPQAQQGIQDAEVRLDHVHDLLRRPLLQVFDALQHVLDVVQERGHTDRTRAHHTPGIQQGVVDVLHRGRLAQVQHRRTLCGGLGRATAPLRAARLALGAALLRLEALRGLAGGARHPLQLRRRRRSNGGRAAAGAQPLADPIFDPLLAHVVDGYPEPQRRQVVDSGEICLRHGQGKLGAGVGG
mmetsp:Transcript_90053/g.251781  ORF Transcript_90053/g.251781 Transcript_90053/m.251781 type:complete len:350 (-) Transcript_90053:249-1298(-)